MRSIIEAMRPTPAPSLLRRAPVPTVARSQCGSFGMEPVHLEQQSQGPGGAGADQKGAAAEAVQLLHAVAVPVRSAPQGGRAAKSSVVYTWPWGRYWRRSWDVKKAWSPRRRRPRAGKHEIGHRIVGEGADQHGRQLGNVEGGRRAPGRGFDGVPLPCLSTVVPRPTQF